MTRRIEQYFEEKKVGQAVSEVMNKDDGLKNLIERKISEQLKQLLQLVLKHGDRLGGIAVRERKHDLQEGTGATAQRL